jgi:hypothetical protein
VFTAHTVTDYDDPAVDTFAGSMAVDMFAGRSLKAAVAIRGGSAVDTVFFIGIMLMKSIKAFGTTGPEFCGPALNTFGHGKLLQ